MSQSVPTESSLYSTKAPCSSSRRTARSTAMHIIIIRHYVAITHKGNEEAKQSEAIVNQQQIDRQVHVCACVYVVYRSYKYNNLYQFGIRTTTTKCTSIYIYIHDSIAVKTTATATASDQRRTQSAIVVWCYHHMWMNIGVPVCACVPLCQRSLCVVVYTSLT